MSKRDQWKKEISEHLSNHYGDFQAGEAKKLDEILETHWKLNQQHSAYVLSRIGGLFLGVGVGSLVNLSGVLPMKPLEALLGRSTFMALSYMAGSHLTAALLERVLPAMERLEQSQLASLFKKADSLQDFLHLMCKINEYLAETVTKDKEDCKIAALGVAGGNILNVGLFASQGINISAMAARSTQAMPVLVSHVAPRVYRQYTHTTQPMWATKFEVKHGGVETPAPVEGMRQRQRLSGS